MFREGFILFGLTQSGVFFLPPLSGSAKSYYEIIHRNLEIVYRVCYNKSLFNELILVIYRDMMYFLKRMCL